MIVSSKLGDEELAVIVEKTVQRLENVRGGEVELVKDDPSPRRTACTSAPSWNESCPVCGSGKTKSKDDDVRARQRGVIRIDAKIERGNRNDASTRDARDVRRDGSRGVTLGRVLLASPVASARTAKARKFFSGTPSSSITPTVLGRMSNERAPARENQRKHRDGDDARLRGVSNEARPNRRPRRPGLDRF